MEWESTMGIQLAKWESNKSIMESENIYRMGIIRNPLAGNKTNHSWELELTEWELIIKTRFTLNGKSSETHCWVQLTLDGK